MCQNPPHNPHTHPTERDGHVTRVLDDTLRSSAVELDGANVATTAATCPADPRSELGVTLPILTLLLKNVGRYVSFEATVRDGRGSRRRFRASNFQPAPRVGADVAALPLRLSPGWNRVTLDLAALTKAAYGYTYVETTRVTVHACCRLRRVYFCAADAPGAPGVAGDVPPEFRLFVPAGAAATAAAAQQQQVVA